MRALALATVLVLSAALPAQAADTQRNHTGGRFMLDVAGNNGGLVEKFDNNTPATTQPALKNTAPGNTAPTTTLHTGTSLRQQPQSRIITGGGIDSKGNKQNQQSIDNVRNSLNDATKDRESDDHMGNFEIQGLMQESNQSQTLQSNVKKKQDDTNNGVIRKAD
jgi:hypothetical protein